MHKKSTYWPVFIIIRSKVFGLGIERCVLQFRSCSHHCTNTVSEKQNITNSRQMYQPWSHATDESLGSWTVNASPNSSFREDSVSDSVRASQHRHVRQCQSFNKILHFHLYRSSANLAIEKLLFLFPARKQQVRNYGRHYITKSPLRCPFSDVRYSIFFITSIL